MEEIDDDLEGEIESSRHTQSKRGRERKKIETEREKKKEKDIRGRRDR